MHVTEKWMIHIKLFEQKENVIKSIRKYVYLHELSILSILFIFYFLNVSIACKLVLSNLQSARNNTFKLCIYYRNSRKIMPYLIYGIMAMLINILRKTNVN